MTRRRTARRAALDVPETSEPGHDRAESGLRDHPADFERFCTLTFTLRWQRPRVPIGGPLLHVRLLAQAPEPSRGNEQSVPCFGTSFRGKLGCGLSRIDRFLDSHAM